jgi:hypothetical protein
LHPLEETKVVEGKLHVEKHPSYGGISFARSNGSHVPLFGSPIQSRSVITLTLMRMEHRRSLNSDFFIDTEQLIEVQMSESQLAQAVFNFNSSPIPVTIKNINGDRYPDPPYVSPYETFKEEFSNKMENISIDADKMVEQATDILTNKNNIGKSDRELILKALSNLSMQIRSNIPYTLEQFSEKMQEVVGEAKQELSAFKENLIRDIGNKTLRDIAQNQMSNLTLDNNLHNEPNV